MIYRTLILTRSYAYRALCLTEDFSKDLDRLAQAPRNSEPVNSEASWHGKGSMSSERSGTAGFLVLDIDTKHIEHFELKLRG